jgi:DNA-nicking Smr family endonuclease
MAKKGDKDKKGGGGPRKDAEKPFNAAFEKALGGMYKELKKAAAPKPPPAPVVRQAVRQSMSDEELFAAEVADVRPIDTVWSEPPPGAPRPVPVAAPGEDDDALMFLDALVSGESVFDIADTDEFIEGCVKDLDRRVVKKLRRGEFAVQAHTDLHGMTKDEAKAAVISFVKASRLSGHRCVLIVHGRGMHSKDQIPVLKDAIRTWLSRGAAGAQVLAFATARPADGGAGAVYVLLRK